MSKPKKYKTKAYQSKPNKSLNQKAPLSKKIIIVAIIVLFIVVAASVIISFFLTPEKRIKSELTNLATDYYENYYYDNLVDLSAYKTEDELRAAMEKYERRGFSQISLRHLLLEYRNSSIDTSLLKNHCDENRTFINIFPEYPYTKTSYHIEYTYSCDF